MREVRGHPEYSVSNPQIGVTMKIEPLPDWQDDTIVRRKDKIEITFVNEHNLSGHQKGVWFEWSYIITEEDIESIDFSNPDFIEEVLSRYGKKFLSLETYHFPGRDGFADYKALIAKIFPDIKGKRKAEGREDY